MVFAGVSDASEIGAATRFNRPEHNFTGPITINRELMPKRLELLKEAFPRLTSIGYLATPMQLRAPQLQEMEAAAQALGLKLIVVQITAAAQLEAAFAGVANGAQAFASLCSRPHSSRGKTTVVVTTIDCPPILCLCTATDPAVQSRTALISGRNFAADYVDRILREARRRNCR